jgi:lipopolysaccharide/colanic/teichoic acid biosynthesis glycosyltransferase
MDRISSTPVDADISDIPHPARRPLRMALRDGIKRAFDMLASFLGLLFLSPLFLLVVWRIRRDSPGPLFYGGRRMGQNGKEFKILKFRTMYEHPDSYSGSPLTTNGDKRITPLGKWLRDSKINELPQLWNVLAGQMSLVGPRPEDPDIVATWPEEVRNKVLSVRPGITSPASIIYRNEENLLNSENVMDDYLFSILPEKLRLDELYVQNQNFFSDLDVIFMTLIMLLPRSRINAVPETVLFSGPLYNFIRRYFSWFIADAVTAMIAIAITGVFWRMSAPLDVGIFPSIGLAVFMAFLLSLCNTLLGLKKVVWQYASPTHVIDLGLSLALSVFGLWLIDNYILSKPLLPDRMLLDFGILTFFGFVVTRYRERMITGIGSRWVQLRGKSTAVGEHVLVIGAGDCSELALWLMKRSQYANAFSIVGFADDDYRKQNYMKNGYPILGTTSDIPALVKQRNIGLILFAISRITPKDRQRIISICQTTSARVVLIPDFIDLFKRSLQEQLVEEQP